MNEFAKHFNFDSDKLNIENMRHFYHSLLRWCKTKSIWYNFETFPRASLCESGLVQFPRPRLTPHNHPSFLKFTMRAHFEPKYSLAPSQERCIAYRKGRAAESYCLRSTSDNREASPTRYRGRKIYIPITRRYDDQPNIKADGQGPSLGCSCWLVHLTGKTSVRKAVARGTRNKSSVRSPRARRTQFNAHTHTHVTDSRTPI